MALGHMCPGASACEVCDPEEFARSQPDGLAPGQAAKIAESVLADPTPSTAKGWGDKWDLSIHSLTPDQVARQAARGPGRGPIQPGLDRRG